MPSNRLLPHSEISAFYREEFLRHKARLEMQRDFYTQKTFGDVQMALNKIINEIDTICQIERFNELAGQLLERIDVITNLSGSPSNQSRRIH